MSARPSGRVRSRSRAAPARTASGCAKWSGTPKTMPAPDERRCERVHPGERVRDREGQVDRAPSTAATDAELEGPLPALPLDHPARPEQRRRPDAHHPGAERGVEERPGTVAGSVHVEGDGREDHRLHVDVSRKKLDVPTIFRFVVKPVHDDSHRAHARSSVPVLRPRARTSGATRSRQQVAGARGAALDEDRRPARSPSVRAVGDQARGGDRVRERQRLGGPRASSRAACRAAR